MGAVARAAVRRGATTDGRRPTTDALGCAWSLTLLGRAWGGGTYPIIYLARLQIPDEIPGEIQITDAIGCESLFVVVVELCICAARERERASREEHFATLRRQLLRKSTV